MTASAILAYSVCHLSFSCIWTKWRSHIL